MDEVKESKKIKKIPRVNIRQIASFVSNENGISSENAMRIFNSQFSFLSEHISKGKFEPVKLDYIGRFYKRVMKRKRGGEE